MRALKRSIERRVSASGFGEPIIQLLGDDRLLVQLPGITDLTRAKEIIGETAQLVYSHRTLNVSQPIPGMSGDDVLSVRVVGLAEDGSVLPKSGLATSTATSADPGAGTQSTTTTPGPVGAATSTLGATGPTATSTATTTPSVIPALQIEFSEEAAEVFAGFVDRLRDSLAEVPGTEQPDPETGELVPGTGDRYPNLLTMAFVGGTSTEIRVPYSPLVSIGSGQVVFLPGGPYVRRVDDSSSFTVSLIGRAADLDEARAIYGEEPTIRFGEVLGKVDEDVGLTGEDMSRAYPGTRAGSGLPIVNIEFNSEGTRKFGELTTRVAGTPNLIAIFLDDQELFASSARRPITGGAAFIESQRFTFDRVRDLSLLLESGRLPVPIDLIQERTVGASLGDESLAKSLVAGIIGLALVLLFMVLYYRVPGVVAAVSLVIYGALFLAIIKLLAISMTLSGVAAAVLSMGMAVDANILIFERMKEELRTGRTLLSAVNIGFNRAWPAIRDGNISTLITCGILFWFADTLGASIVQVFAITLAIGVAVSMFSAITVSRTLLRALTTTRLNRRLALFLPSGGTELPQQRQGAEGG
jgi:protein-export membrane protein SecD